MKKNIALFLLLFCSAVQIYAEKPKTILKKFDVVEKLPQVSDGDAETFWRNVVDKDIQFQELLKKIYNKKGTAKKAREKIEESIQDGNKSIRKYIEFDSLLDSLKYHLAGYTKRAEKIKISYLSIGEENAFTTPDGNIYMCYGLMDVFPENELYRMVIATLAHEMVHSMLQHALVGKYKTLKKEKANRIMAYTMGGLMVAADGYAASQGFNTADGKSYSNMIRNFEMDSYLYQFSYSRNQEYEADIIAFRLLDWIGFGGEAIIDLLKCIEQPFEYADKESNHPTIKQRIAVLEYMCTQPRVLY